MNAKAEYSKKPESSNNALRNSVGLRKSVMEMKNSRSSMSLKRIKSDKKLLKLQKTKLM
jgi:hypothetical protein